MNLSLKDIDIMSIIRDIYRNALFIVLAVITAVLAVIGVESMTYKPQYTSTATLAVTMKGNNGGSYSSLYMTTEMASIFSEVFSSDALKKKIADDLSVNSINGSISVSLIPETNLLILTVVSDAPKSAYMIITSALENYDTVSDYLFTNANLDVLKEPTVPYSPSNPRNVSRMCKLTALAAIAVMLVAIAIISFFRQTIKNPASARRHLDARILGVIPYVAKFKTTEEIMRHWFKIKRRNIAVLVSSPMFGMHFVEAYKKVSTVIESHMKKREQKVLLVTGACENTGKSSVATNIAITLSERGNRVLIIDADLRKPASYKIFNRKDKMFSFSDCLTQRCTIYDALCKEATNLFCIYQQRMVKDPGKLLSSKRTKQLIDACRKNFDYIVVDSPPIDVAADAEMLMQYCDAVILAVYEDKSTIGTLNDTIDIIKNMDIDFIGVVLNAFRSKMPTEDSKYGYGRYGRYGSYERYGKYGSNNKN